MRRLPDYHKKYSVQVTTVCLAVLLLFVGGITQLRPEAQVSQSNNTSTPVVGFFDGTFSVHGGVALYSIALPVPPGTAHMEPKLSLSYNSRSGNGVLGKGWRLAGLSQVMRCKATLVQDGFTGGINYDDNDQFCLDSASGRLIEISSNDTSAAFRTELDNWHQIEAAYANCGGGPCSFTVTDRRGTVYQYGGTTDSAVLASGDLFKSGTKKGAVRQWLLNQITDLNGNTLTVSYTNSPSTTDGSTISDAGRSYIDTIAYTANGSMTAARQVNFLYQQRTDTFTQYLGGGIIETSALLSEIDTALTLPDNSSQTISRFVLTYQTNPNSGFSRLSQVSRCSGTSECLPEIQLSWSDGPDSLSQKSLPSNPVTGQSCKLPNGQDSRGWTGDFNGDGLSDIINYPCDPQLFYANGSAFETPIPLSIEFDDYDNTWVSDFNGDGKEDLYLSNNNSSDNMGQLWLATDATATNKGFACVTQNGSTDCANIAVDQLGSTFVADFTGDGLTDLFTSNSAGGMLYVGTGSGFDDGTPTGAVGEGDASTCTVGGAFTCIADFNADGLTDILTGDSSEATLYYANGSGFGDGTSTGVDLSGDYQWVGDFNGDAMPDLLVANGTTGTVYYATGYNPTGEPEPDVYAFATGLPITNINLGQGNIWVNDFNGDSLMDLYVATSTSGQLYLADGSGFSCIPDSQDSSDCAQLSNTLNVEQIWLGDFNGDGLTDLFSADEGNNVMNWMAQDGTVQASSGLPDLLTGVSNSIGGQVSIVYEPITNSSVYTIKTNSTADDAQAEARALVNAYNPTPLSPIQAPSYPERLVRSASYVVSSYTHSSDGGGTASDHAYQYTYALSYENALYNRLGRGWLGFAAVTLQDAILGRIVTTNYQQDFPYTGQVQQRVSCEASSGICEYDSDDLLTYTSYQYVCQDTQSNKECIVNNDAPYQSGDTQLFMVLKQLRFAAHASWGYELAKGYTYDDYGNTTLVSDLGDTANDNSVPIYTCYQYYPPDTQAGTIGFPQYKKQTANSNCLTNIDAWQTGDVLLQQYIYDTNMNLAQNLAWDDENDGWSGYRYKYDPYGNPYLRTQMAGNPAADISNTTWTTAYDSNYNTFAIQTTSPVPDTTDPNSKALVRNYAWDARFGIRIAAQDPNGNIRNTCVDDFGRITATQGPNTGSTNVDGNCLSSATYPYIGSAFVQNTNLATLTTNRWSLTDDGTYERHHALRASWSSPSYYDAVIHLDGLNRAYEVTHLDEDANEIRVKTEYLNKSLVHRRSLPYVTGNPVWKRISYDAYGRPNDVHEPYQDVNGTLSELKTHYHYSAPNKVETIEAQGESATYTRKTAFNFYNGRRKVTKVEQGDDATTHYQYDILGRSTQVTSPPSADGTSVVNKMKFDSLGRMTQLEETSLGSRSYHFGANGTLNDQKDSLGQAIYYSYDNLQRVKTKRYVDSNGKETGKVYFAWDYSESDIDTNLRGRKSQAYEKDAQGNELYHYHYGYDGYGHKNSETLNLGGVDFLFTNQLYPSRKIQTLTYPALNGVSPIVQVDYSPNAGYLQSISFAPDGQSFDAIVTYSDFTPFGTPGTAVYQNQTQEGFDYDTTGRIHEHTIADATGTVLVDEVYAWDTLFELQGITDCTYQGNAGNSLCTTVGNNSTDAGQQLVYSDKRLTQASGPYGALLYCYDDAGNLTQKSDDIQYKYSGNQVAFGYTVDSDDCTAQPGAQVYAAQYDANGNMKFRTSSVSGTAVDSTFSYDVENRLISTETGGVQSESYLYDYSGRRLVKQVYSTDGSTVDSAVLYLNPIYELSLSSTDNQYTLYVHNAAGRLVSISDDYSDQASLKMLQEAFLGAASADLAPSEDTDTAQVLFFHRNMVTSTQIVTDSSGALSSTATYTPYGSATFSPSDSNTYRYTFIDRELDAGSGLYYLDARYMDPTTGRFITADSQLGSHKLRQDAFNRYAYALNSPLTYADPKGHSPLMDVLMVVQLGLAVVTAGTASLGEMAVEAAVEAGEEAASEQEAEYALTSEQAKDQAHRISNWLADEIVIRDPPETDPAVSVFVSKKSGYAYLGISGSNTNETAIFARTLGEYEDDILEARKLEFSRLERTDHSNFLYTRADKIQRMTLENWSPQSCAEFRSCVRAANWGERLEDLVGETRRLYPDDVDGNVRLGRCMNCQVTTHGAVSVPDTEAFAGDTTKIQHSYQNLTSHPFADSLQDVITEHPQSSFD